MITILLGASCSGKSSIEKTLIQDFGFKSIVSYTTREPRIGEKNGTDYHFITNEKFEEMIKENLFAEYCEYSRGRFYGTLKTDYTKDNAVVVLTPSGFEAVKDSVGLENVFSVLVQASLGTRIKRYIDRCGILNFNFDDKNEISSRVERDFGMFIGIEKKVNMTVYNNEGDNVKKIAESIYLGGKL